MMGAIQLTDEIITAAEHGDPGALANVLEYFRNDIKKQCSDCTNPMTAAKKRKHIENCLIEELKTEWPKIRTALQRSFQESKS